MALTVPSSVTASPREAWRSVAPPSASLCRKEAVGVPV
jgi:hypothetical protein